MITTYTDELYGLGALHFAAIYGRVDLIHKFIRKGADPNKIDNHSITPLHYAVLSGRAEVVDAFLSGDGSVNVNIADSLCRRTALHTAIINKVDNRIITALINNNANLSLIDTKGCTALHYAVINKNSEAIDAMIQNGISTEYKNIIDRNRCVPLHYAVMNNADITHLKLLKTDTNSSMQDLNKCTPLHYAVELYHRLLQNRASREEIANAKEIIQALICQHPEYGTNINIKDQDGRTPLHYATLYGLQDIANIFIGTDHCNYTLQDTQRMTPLHYAVRSNSNDVLEVIVGKESIAQNIDIIGDKGLTPLHLAAIYGNKEAAEFLIGNNANVNAQDSEGRTALHLAVMSKQSEIVSLLLSKKGIDYKQTRSLWITCSLLCI